MKLLVLHTLPPKQAAPGHTTDEFDLHGAAQAIGEAIPDAVVAGIRGEVAEVIAHLDRHQPEVVFNLCEAPLGRPDLEAHVASLLEWTGVRFTGCRSETLALCRRKDLVGAILHHAGVPVPAAIDPARPLFPCIVKPAGEDGSAGLDHDSVCDSRDALARTLERMQGPVVVQEFLPGREFAVSLWGASRPDHVSVGETIFQSDLKLVTYAAKWHVESADFADSPLFYNSTIAPELRQAIVTAARGAWQAVGARQLLLRVDIRLDSAGCPRVLDVNPNPEMSPGVGHLASRRRGRLGMAGPHSQVGGMGVSVRPFAAADRKAIADILVESGAFSPEETGVALQMIDAGLAEGPEQRLRIVCSRTGPDRVRLCLHRSNAPHAVHLASLLDRGASAGPRSRGRAEAPNAY